MNRGRSDLYALVLAGLLGACAHWQSHGEDEAQGAASVRLVEAGQLPPNCRLLGPVSVTRGAFQDDRTIELKLRNAAVAKHGNLVLITRRSTLTAEGEVHDCREAEPPPAPQVLNVSHTTAADGGRAHTPQLTTGGIEENTLDSRARELFVLGREAYLKARYEDALRYFNAAFDLSGRYELHYNIGQSADKLHRDSEALAAFEHFLESAPPSPLRTETEARVATLRAH